MSPRLLRRYRADRLLREEFEALRKGVIGAVSARLRAAGAVVDPGDLEAAYAQAWHGLYAAVLEGREIANPAGWLTVVTHRRAIDEHRARRRATPTTPRYAELARAPATPREPDIAEALDDRARLGELLEALRARLSERERQAAALCYLQGLSRAEAAARMGISESRMRKLMEGAGRGLRGVAAKVGALARTIAAGEWCEQQGSLMRGLAFGVLDPRGERYRLALAHTGRCPACRAYVRSLRGLAVVLPPSPLLLQWIAAEGAVGLGASAAGAGAGAAPGTAPGAGGATGQVGTGLPQGALGAPGAAGAAGGGWWLAGGAGAKLAVGCVLAAGLGAGCVAIERASQGSRGPGHHHAAHGRAAGLSAGRAASREPGAAALAASAPSSGAVRTPSSGSGTLAGDVAREFGPEGAVRGAAEKRATGTTAARLARSPARARAATSPVTPAPREGATAQGSEGSHSATGSPAAEREFAPG